MRAKGLVWVVLVVFLAGTAAPAAAAEGDKIVRTKPGLLGLDVLGTVCGLLGCQVIGILDTDPGNAQNAQLFLVRNLLTTVVTPLLAVLGLVAIEPDRPVSTLQSTWTGGQASAAVVNALDRRDPMEYHGTVAWQGYLDQVASGIVGVTAAHCGYGLTGVGSTVAVIDTGVDLSHPALQSVLTGGYDFLNDAEGGGENGVGQASAAVVNAVWVNSTTIVVLDQAPLSAGGVGLAEFVAGYAFDAITVGRTRMLARYEFALEATRRPELRAVYDEGGLQIRRLAASVLEAAGSSSAERHARVVVDWMEGTIFGALAGTGSLAPPGLEELVESAREILAGIGVE